LGFHDAVEVVLVTLEVEDRIDQVLQEPRAGDAAGFHCMANHDDSHPPVFSILLNFGSARTHLGGAAGQGRNRLVFTCLNRVDY
jgi:hypothetical protein